MSQGALQSKSGSLVAVRAQGVSRGLTSAATEFKEVHRLRCLRVLLEHVRKPAAETHDHQHEQCPAHPLRKLDVEEQDVDEAGQPGSESDVGEVIPPRTWSQIARD